MSTLRRAGRLTTTLLIVAAAAAALVAQPAKAGAPRTQSLPAPAHLWRAFPLGSQKLERQREIMRWRAAPQGQLDSARVAVAAVDTRSPGLPRAGYAAGALAGACLLLLAAWYWRFVLRLNPSPLTSSFAARRRSRPVRTPAPSWVARPYRMPRVRPRRRRTAGAVEVAAELLLPGPAGGPQGTLPVRARRVLSDTGNEPSEVATARRSHAASVGYTLVVPDGRKYVLVDRSGTVPVNGAVIELTEPDPAGSFVAELVGPSPLPGDPRPCVFLQRL